MQRMKKIVGILDTYNRGKVKHIDFTYADCIVVWVEFKNLCRAYKWSLGR